MKVTVTVIALPAGQGAYNVLVRESIPEVRDKVATAPVSGHVMLTAVDGHRLMLPIQSYENALCLFETEADVTDPRIVRPEMIRA
jgi:hypothetical protein